MTLLLCASVGCASSEHRDTTSTAAADSAVALSAAAVGAGCAPDAASKFQGDTSLFGVRNACGRWHATPAQSESTTLYTGFRDSVLFSLADCPASSPVDSLVFGTIDFSSETGDASGVQLIFERRGRWVRGVQIEGEGGISAPASLRGLAVAGTASQLRFWVPTAPRTIVRYEVALTCKSVVGTMRFRDFADGRYDDGASLSEPIPVELTRSTRVIPRFP